MPVEPCDREEAKCPGCPSSSPSSGLVAARLPPEGAGSCSVCATRVNADPDRGQGDAGGGRRDGDRQREDGIEDRKAERDRHRNRKGARGTETEMTDGRMDGWTDTRSQPTFFNHCSDSKIPDAYETWVWYCADSTHQRKSTGPGVQSCQVWRELPSARPAHTSHFRSTTHLCSQNGAGRHCSSCTQ